MNSQSRTLRSNCVCQGGRSDSMTTGGLKNDDRNWPHRSAPQRLTPHRSAPQSLNFLGYFLCSVKAENPNGIDDVGWRLVFDLFLLDDDQLCLVTLRVRVSYLRAWTSEGTFDVQWKPRILMALTVLVTVEFSFFFFKMMTSCALLLCACGRRSWESERLSALFMLSDSRES
jgi:hypothetical protein